MTPNESIRITPSPPPLSSLSNVDSSSIQSHPYSSLKVIEEDNTESSKHEGSKGIERNNSPNGQEHGKYQCTSECIK